MKKELSKLDLAEVNEAMIARDIQSLIYRNSNNSRVTKEFIEWVSEHLHMDKSKERLIREWLLIVDKN